MKKAIMAVTGAGLIAAISLMLFIARNEDWALGGANKHPTQEAALPRTTVTYTVEKNGVTKTVEAIKGGEFPLPLPAEQPPDYDPGDRDWDGDPQTWAQLIPFIRDAFQAQRDASLYANRERSEELKGNLANYFSTSSGILQKKRNTIDMEMQSALTGYGRSESVITKMDFKGISVQDNQATAVVDIYSHTSWKDFKTNKDDGGGDNAEQHTVTLEQENDQWLITKDLWVFLPGYGP
ncbi:MAG: hypothetical protein M1539_04980 [Actinobacteria bacterium]|nr:hypothetical protein [Actinomycetota bacterium]